MNRRTVLKNVLFISAGTVLLPACKEEKPSIQLTNLSLTADQEKMIAALSAAIIPSGNNFIGAADIKAHQFALMMVDDCEPPEMQKKFLDGMKKFEKETGNKKFDKLSDKEKNEILLKFENKKDVSEEAQLFY